MAEKVKLTREQAELLDREEKGGKEKYETIKRFVQMHGEHGRDFHLDELIKALYIGYEVEEEFKVGDWIVTKDGMVAEIIDVCMFHKDSVVLYEVDGRHSFDTLRHATPEEIEKEKQRRWWAKHGREAWEVRALDIVENKSSGDLLSVSESYVNEFKNEAVQDNYEVVCFAEDRKDVQA